jgi:hypothetical protein
MRYDDPNVPLSVVFGLIGAILVFVVIVVLQALFFHMQEAEFERKVYSQPNQELARLRAGQMEILSSYRWIDERSGVVGIPVERAMEKVAAEAGR